MMRRRRPRTPRGREAPEVLQRVAIGFLSALVALGATAACTPENLAEQVVEAGSDGRVDIDDGEITIEGEDGSTTISGGTGSLPDGFPDDVPVVKGQVTFAQRMTDSDSGTSYSVLIEAPGSVEDVFDQVTSDLTGAGFEAGDQTVISGEAADGSFATAQFTSPDWNVTVSVTGSGESCVVTYAVVPAA